MSETAGSAATWRFRWPRTRQVLDELLARHELRPAPDGRGFLAVDAAGQPAVRVVLPLCLPPVRAAPAADYVAELPDELGVQVVVLLQAGAAALGLLDLGELVLHKVIKKYVVRGQGRAQPTHLKTKGKSRYGSRLRLRNARQLLVEVNERLWSWHDETPDAERLFLSCPVRLASDLFATRPAPPWPRESFTRVPIRVGVPSFDELRRVCRFLGQGRVEPHP